MSKILVQKPSIGRVVHYQAYGTPGGEFKSVPRAAIITDLHPDEGPLVVSVCVLNPQGIFFNKVQHTTDGKPGCWSYPPQVLGQVEIDGG